MKKIYLLCEIILLFTLSSRAQEISITKIGSDIISNTKCTNKPIYFYYTTKGVFEKDNVFSVLISDNSRDNWQRIPSKDSSGILKITISESSFQTNNRLYFKVVSSSPKVESNIMDDFIYSIPKLTITGASKSNIEINELVYFKGSITGQEPYNITIDGDSASYNNISYLADALFKPSKSGQYSVSKISNRCGVGEATGVVDISINSAGFNLYNTPRYICQGSTLHINIKPFGNWKKENPIAIRLLKSDSDKIFYDINASINDEIVTAIIPETIPYNEYYKMKIVGVNSTYESDEAVNVVMVYQKPSVDLISSSSEVVSGETKELIVQYKGLAPFFALLSDGTQLSNLYRSGEDQQSIRVNPLSTTDYKIVSFNSGCGTGVGQNQVRLTLKGEDVIRTDSLKSKRYCGGELAEVYFSSTKEIKIGSTVSVALTNYPKITDTRYFTIVEGVIKDSKTVTFKLPNNPSAIFENQIVYAQVRLNNMKSQSFSTNSLYLLEKASFTGMGAYSAPNLVNPKDIIFEIYAKGGEPYTLTFNDGLVVSADKNNSILNGLPLVHFNVTKDKEYRLKSISNFCGTTDALPSSAFKFTVANPANAEIELTSKGIAYGQKVCEGQKIKLDINTIGTFEAGTTFNVELLTNALDVSGTIIAKTENKTVDIVIPSGYSAGEYFLRVSSTTNTVIYSNVYAIQIAKKATASFYSDQNQTSIFDGTEVTLNTWVLGTAPFEITYLDNSKKQLFSFDALDGSYYISQKKKPSQTTTFGIKSISNVCGEGVLNNNQVVISVKRFSLVNDLVSGMVCSKSTFAIPFHIEGMNVDTSDRYTVQIAKLNDTSYVTLKADIKASPAFVPIPNTFGTGIYSIRIVSNKYKIQSDIRYFNIADVPTGSISFNGGLKENEINWGEPLSLNVTITNGYGLSTISLLENGYIKSYKNDVGSIANIYKYPIKESTYKLTSVANSCGTRDINETIKVKVKAVLSHSLNNMRDYLCLGKNVDLTIDGQGDFGADNTFKVYIINNTTKKSTEVLSTTKSGNVSFKIPEILEKGYYTVQVESSNPVLKSSSSVLIISTPEVVLSGANGQIMNPGNERTLTLSLIPREDASRGIIELSSYSYEFTDGTKGTIRTDFPVVGLYVSPQATKTYTLKNIYNSCGVGKASGSVKIVVNPASDKKVLTESFVGYSQYLCRGTMLSISFNTSGTFSSSNKFIVQMSDKNGENFRDIETTGNTSPLSAKIPIDSELGGNYLFKVVSSDKDATSTTNTNPLQVVEEVTARFVDDSYSYEANKTASIKIKFTGMPGYNFRIGRNQAEAASNSYSATDSIHIFKFTPVANTTSLRLFEVSNATCGIGTIKSPSSIRLELITGIDELINLGVKLFPNPTDDKVMIESDGSLTTIRITDSIGKVIDELDTTDSQKEMSLSSYPSGVYFFQIFKKGKVATFKVYKL